MKNIIICLIVGTFFLSVYLGTSYIDEVMRASYEDFETNDINEVFSFKKYIDVTVFDMVK